MRRRHRRRRTRGLHVRAVHGARRPQGRHRGQESRCGRAGDHQPHRQLPGRGQGHDGLGPAGQDARAGHRVRHGLPAGPGLHGGRRGQGEGRVHAGRDREGARAGPGDGRHGPHALVQGRGRVPGPGRELLRDVRRRLLPRRGGRRRRRGPGGRRGGRVPDQVRLDGALADAVRPEMGRGAARRGAPGPPERQALVGDALDLRRRRRRGRDGHHLPPEGLRGRRHHRRGLLHLRRRLQAHHGLPGGELRGDAGGRRRRGQRRDGDVGRRRVRDRRHPQHALQAGRRGRRGRVHRRDVHRQVPQGAEEGPRGLDPRPMNLMKLVR
mmetsp:Transcript_828/g.2435  ORF Transcript_828/g.2435 Transcript_828/m.2435 type:complete len:324 (+) Transcript_828:272-1243(+)